MTTPTRRCGLVKALTLDVDAVPLLAALCPSTKATGRFVSELIRKEYALREDRARRRQGACPLCGARGDEA